MRFNSVNANLLVACAAVISSTTAAFAGAVAPTFSLFDEDRRINGFVMVPLCGPVVSQLDVAGDFDPFDSTVAPQLTCAAASGILTATQQSQIDPTSMTAAGSSTSHASAIQNLVIHSIGGSFFDVTFFVDAASPYSIQGVLGVDFEGAFIGMGMTASVSLTGPGGSVIFQSSLSGFQVTAPTTQPVQASGVLAPGTYRLRAQAQSMIDATIPPDREGGASYDIIINLPGPPLGDLNGDGVVNTLDLGILLSSWGNCPIDDLIGCPADLNDDGEIDTLDLGILLSHWTL